MSRRAALRRRRTVRRRRGALGRGVRLTCDLAPAPHVSCRGRTTSLPEERSGPDSFAWDARQRDRSALRSGGRRRVASRGGARGCEMCVHGEGIVCRMREDRVRVGCLRRLFTACAIRGAGPSAPGVWMYLASLCVENFLPFGCARQNELVRTYICGPTSGKPHMLRSGRTNNRARPFLADAIRLCPVAQIDRPRHHPSAISDAPSVNAWVVRCRWRSASVREVRQRSLTRLELQPKFGDRWAGLTGTGLARVAHLQGKPPLCPSGLGVFGVPAICGTAQ